MNFSWSKSSLFHICHSPQTNYITAVPARCFPNGMTDISFQHNPITNIDDDAFEGSTSTLQSITFWGARFTRIPDAFRRLTALTHLTIDETLISDWNLDVMKIIGQTVQTLFLQDVGLKSWPSWIQYFPRLTELSLDDSSISFVPDDALDTLAHSLTGLSISNGSLTTIPRAFSKLQALESLHLGHNKITNLTFIPRLSKLSSISLDHNKISDPNHLSDALRPFSNSLMSIELENNLLTSIPYLSFLSKVGSLDFSHNLISDPSLGSVPEDLYDLNLGYNRLPAVPFLWISSLSVTSLVLPSNEIRYIHGTDFHSSTFEVDLGYNLITEMTDDSFLTNCSIRVIHLVGNPITTISMHAFENLPLLMTLDLSHTKLSRLPIQLRTLVNLVSLDMSSCNDLVCTCNEKKLGPWILSLENVYGDCGVESIHNFFDTLSADCPDL